MAKKTIPLYIDDELYKRLTERGWCVSHLCNMIMEEIDGETWNDVNVSIKLRVIEEELQTTDLDLIKTRTHLEFLVNRKKELEDLKSQTLSTWKEVQTTGRLHELMNKLNHVLIANMFDEEEVVKSQADVLAGIVALNPTFDLSSHIIRLRDILES